MIDVKSLGFRYTPAREILKEVSFEAAAGHMTAILGNNGAGKSTLVKCIDRILAPQGGHVYVEGADVGGMRRKLLARKVAYVSQKADGARLTVFDAVLLGRKPHMGLNPSEEDLRIVTELLSGMGLSEFSLRPVDELSGGELQKVMLARALAQRPRVLLLDEPTSNLDLKNQYETLRLMRGVATRENIAVVLIIHDLNLALRYCDRFVLLRGGGVYDEGGPEVVTPEAILAVYGVEAEIIRARGVPVVVPVME